MIEYAWNAIKNWTDSIDAKIARLRTERAALVKQLEEAKVLERDPRYKAAMYNWTKSGDASLIENILSDKKAAEDAEITAMKEKERTQRQIDAAKMSMDDLQTRIDELTGKKTKTEQELFDLSDLKDQMAALQNDYFELTGEEWIPKSSAPKGGGSGSGVQVPEAIKNTVEGYLKNGFTDQQREELIAEIAKSLEAYTGNSIALSELERLKNEIDKAKSNEQKDADDKRKADEAKKAKIKAKKAEKATAEKNMNKRAAEKSRRGRFITAPHKGTHYEVDTVTNELKDRTPEIKI